MTTSVRFSFARRRRGLGLVWPTVLAVVVAVATYVAARVSSDERIAQLWVAATVLEDGGAEVVEVIDYDFGTADRHGIFRDIPELRTSEPVRVSSPTAPDDVDLNTLAGLIPQVRIGDPDETVTGLHRYVLRYTLDEVVQDGRIAWDAVGTEWDVPIDDVEVHVVAPATLQRVTCRVGRSGSTDPCDVSDEVPGHLVATIDHLDPGTGVTVFAPLGEPLAAVPAVPDPPSMAASTGVAALAPAVLAGLLALLGGLATKWLLRRAGRHHAPRLGLPGQAPGETVRVDGAELESYAAPSSRLPDTLTPTQGAILLANNGPNFWDMASWLAEQAAAGTIDLEPAEDGDEEKSLVLVRRQPGDGVAREVLDRAFGGRERIPLGSYDSRFSRASSLLREHMSTWRETSDLWDRAAARRTKVAKRVGRYTGLGGLVLAVFGGTLASSAGIASLALAGLGALLAAAGLCVALTFWDRGVFTPEGTAAWLQVESLRQYLTQTYPRVEDVDLPTDRLDEYTAWAVALDASEQWARIASRIAETTRTPVEVSATDTGVHDQYFWLRYAAIGQTLTTSCHATSYEPPRLSLSSGSSGGSSYSSSSSSSSSSVGGGSGGGGGGSW